VEKVKRGECVGEGEKKEGMMNKRGKQINGKEEMGE
jgi:hypothetical protein